jgi:nucleotide-binding universal stress UspA family protein
MYDRIIVPIERGVDVEALDQPRAVARSLSCELVLLHVHQPREAPAELEGLPQFRYQHVVEAWDGRDADEQTREAAWLAELVAAVALADPDLTVSGRVVDAPLSRCVHEQPERERVLAMVPAPRDGERVMDASAQELIRACRIPVLLFPPGIELLPVGRIMVALDGSTFSEEALPPAIELARATGARLTLLEVVTQHTGLVRFLHPAERSAETAEQWLDTVRDRIPPEAGPVDCQVIEHESAAGGIIMEARRGGVDLVALATHGRGGLRRLLFGSVAERVVQDCPVPVLVFRPEGSGAGAKTAGLPAASGR